MIPISTTELPALTFSEDTPKHDYHAQASKIGWMRATAKPGTTFDISIKDALGREKAHKSNCLAAQGEFGELINLPVMVGENLSVEVSNIKGDKSVTLFLN